MRGFKRGQVDGEQYAQVTIKTRSQSRDVAIPVHRDTGTISSGSSRRPAAVRVGVVLDPHSADGSGASWLTDLLLLVLITWVCAVKKGPGPPL